MFGFRRFSWGRGLALFWALCLITFVADAAGVEAAPAPPRGWRLLQSVSPVFTTLAVYLFARAESHRNKSLSFWLFVVVTLLLQGLLTLASPPWL